jgi:O-antigen ligase
VLLGLGLASAIFGISRQLLQAPDSERGFVLPFLFAGVGYGQFLSPNVFAYLMEMIFALFVGLLLGGGVRKDRIPIYLVGILIVWSALVLSNSRGAIFGFTAQSIFLLFVSLSWYSTRRLSRTGESKPRWLTFLETSVLVRIIVIIVMSTALAAGVFWMGGQELVSKTNSQANSEERMDGLTRREIWHSSWQLVKEHPLTGVGFGAYFLAIPKYQSGSGRIRLEEAHNDYLDLAANGGLVAVGLAFWFIAIIVWRTRKSFKSADPYRRAAALGAAAGILSICLHSLVDFGLQVTGIGVVFAALVVVAVADDRLVASPERRNVDRLRRRRRRKLPGDSTGVELT